MPASQEQPVRRDPAGERNELDWEYRLIGGADAMLGRRPRRDGAVPTPAPGTPLIPGGPKTGGALRDDTKYG